jgi:hypothetical protein
MKEEKISTGSPRRTRSSSPLNGMLRDELPIVVAFKTPLEAEVLAEDFRIESNRYRPHSPSEGSWLSNRRAGAPERMVG